MTVGKIDALLMLGVAFLAIADYLIYTKLMEYVYISAGVTRNDVFQYRFDTHSNNPKLFKWMESRALHPREFRKMQNICHILSFLAGISIFVLMLTLQLRNVMITRVYFVISLMSTVLISVYGFINGKRIEAEFGGYFESSAYKPYESSNEDAYEHDRLYEENPQSHNYPQRTSAVRFNFIPFIIVLVVFFGVFIFQKFYTSEPVNDAQSVTASQEDVSYDERAGDMAIDINKLCRALTEEGFECYDAYGEISIRYPEYNFINCMEVNAEGLYFGCYELDCEENAEHFYDDAKSELQSNAGLSQTEKRDRHKGFVIYFQEMEDGFCAVICSENKIIFANCDKLTAAWLKSFLYDNGFLETF